MDTTIDANLHNLERLVNWRDKVQAAPVTGLDDVCAELGVQPEELGAELEETAA